METAAPTAATAAALVRRLLAREPAWIERFSSGLMHYVYDVAFDDGTSVVVRLGRAGAGRHFAGAVYWHRLLAPLGVPLPRLLGHDVAPPEGFPYLILERLPGRDLGEVYQTLTAEQKRDLARRIAAYQGLVATLPAGPGFGYAFSYDDTLHATWSDVLEADLDRSLRRIRAVGLVEPRIVERVAAKLAGYGAYFSRVEPRPFLDDTTTKNVLLRDGRLSGIVDVDVVCFGDRLLTPALTQMALLSKEYDTDYVRYWCAALGLDGEHERVLTLYTALFCVGFLSEIGQRFNQAAAEPVMEGHAARLLAVLDDLLDRC